MTELRSTLAQISSGTIPLGKRRRVIWDLPTRALHWLLVACLGICWWTGVHNQLDYHQYAGYAILWIIIMRVYWGFVGSSSARFANFIRGPKTTFHYARTLVRRDTAHMDGHNPIGAISILALLGLPLAVVIAGLFAVDVDGLYSGPLSSYVSFRQGRHLAHLHYWLFTILLWLLVLHLAAIAFYFIYKRQDLLRPMVTGSRPCAADESDKAEMLIAPSWRFLAGAVVTSAFVWAVSKGFYL